MQICTPKHLCVYRIASKGTGCIWSKDYTDYSWWRVVRPKRDSIVSWILVFRPSRTGYVKVKWSWWITWMLLLISFSRKKWKWLWNVGSISLREQCLCNVVYSNYIFIIMQLILLNVKFTTLKHLSTLLKRFCVLLISYCVDWKYFI